MLMYMQRNIFLKLSSRKSSAAGLGWQRSPQGLGAFSFFFSCSEHVSSVLTLACFVTS